ncbi:sigma 54-interacting transcriptional regulator [Polyangium jinanense]|uniref:Sigma 54-dependent Fis family transcriptional regulator n=1 Tax=Polyangium jinanense TaxID=2829994 RepID=A0A9X4AT24_9BACT|nr:sigma 54-interacting transcriptional regulator [Polyangium jinanense]MDC3961650.1 sigma 54-dependent Fis family transcriptional regulator [Polyangium jinanense]MDC3983749.1 sigma 54-dependent Fis family transcriptional regulator [Polyangium jinanense]
MSAKSTLPLHSRPKELRLDGFSLTVIEGPGAGTSLRAQMSEVSVGTAQGNDLVLPDPTVSRHHFSLSATSEGYLLKDLGSSNGTWVSGMRVLSGYVEPGARVRVGRTTLLVDQVNEDICEALSPEDGFGPLLGASAAMRRIFAALPRVAQSESTVLLEGETGTGKGVLAAAIHEASPRASGPFVVLDCAAIAPTLIESELFGHVKGSFTGAQNDRAGAFEQAKGGTIFIDEIGELPLDMQPKLLRALEERSVKRVGSNQRVKLDVRVIAATNRDLRTEVNRNTFRADLFYRLNVVRIHVPPLRERTGDIERLARHFHAELVPDQPIPDELLESLRRQSWPGNVRELRAAIERAVLLNDPAVLALGNEVESGPGMKERDDDIDLEVPFRVCKQKASDQWERRYVRALLRATNDNISEASRRVKMDRSHLRTLLRKYGFRGADEGGS